MKFAHVRKNNSQKGSSRIRGALGHPVPPLRLAKPKPTLSRFPEAPEEAEPCGRRPAARTHKDRPGKRPEVPHRGPSLLAGRGGQHRAGGLRGKVAERSRAWSRAEQARSRHGPLPPAAPRHRERGRTGRRPRER